MSLAKRWNFGLKRRLKAAGEEVGLKVTSARMHLMKEMGVRVVCVDAVVSDWTHETPTLPTMASIQVNGAWPDHVDIRCVGTNENPLSLQGPWMKGRNAVPLEELIERETGRFQALKHVRAVRFKGLMFALDLVAQDSPQEAYDASERVGHKVCDTAVARGLLIRPLGDVVYLVPPLVTTAEQLARMLQILYDSIVEVTA